MYPRTLPNADVHFVAQEFGTYHVVRVLRALRAENRWHHYGDGGIDHATKLTLRERFAPEDESWRKAVLDRGRIVIGQALGLLRPGPFEGPPSVRSLSMGRSTRRAASAIHDSSQEDQARVDIYA